MQEALHLALRDASFYSKLSFYLFYLVRIGDLDIKENQKQSQTEKLEALLPPKQFVS